MVTDALGTSIKKKRPCYLERKKQVKSRGLQKATFTPGGCLKAVSGTMLLVFTEERVPMASLGWRLGILLRPGSQWGRLI